MIDLERELGALGRELDFPLQPDVSARVRERIEARRSWLPRRRGLTVALAALAVAAAGVLAVPPARTAILELLGLRGVTIERVGELPPVRPRGDLAYLGERLPLAEARRRTPFAIREPTLDGLDDPKVFVRSWPTRTVTLVYGDVAEPRLVLTQFRARIEEEYVQKVVGTGTTVQRLTVDGGRAIWLSGEPHGFAFVDARGRFSTDTFYLARNTLIWESGELTLRIEGELTREQALTIAESVR
jgi:hypothetical protein